MARPFAMHFFFLAALLFLMASSVTSKPPVARKQPKFCPLVRMGSKPMKTADGCRKVCKKSFGARYAGAACKRNKQLVEFIPDDKEKLENLLCWCWCKIKAFINGGMPKQPSCPAKIVEPPPGNDDDHSVKSGGSRSSKSSGGYGDKGQ